MKFKESVRKIFSVCNENQKKVINILGIKFKFKLHHRHNIASNEKKLLKQLKEKIKRKEKINVCFKVNFDAIFPSKPIFELMSKDKMFNAFILVVPHTKNNQLALDELNQTYQTYSSKYENVFNSYDENRKQFIDFSDKYDIIFDSCPYDSITHEYYTISKNKNNHLVFYIDYGYIITNWYDAMGENKVMNTLFRHFVTNKFQCRELRKRFNNKTTFQVFGYPKMDELAKFKKVKNKRKKIILAPHHTVGKQWEQALSLSNFFSYSDLFLSLPEKYPQVDWIFRPHPLLMNTLKEKCNWTQEQIDNYKNKMSSYANVTCQWGGDYLETFINSDGLIHDCGSFMAEYLFTGQPCCYMLKDEKTTKMNHNNFALFCIDQHYKAFSENDIINFIDNVILKEQDPLKKQRTAFFNRYLKCCYPNATKKIYRHIKNIIK